MLRWAKRRPFFRCVHVLHAVDFLDRRPWWDAHAQEFVSPFASKAGRLDASTGTLVKISDSKRSKNYGSASVSGSLVGRPHAYHATGVGKFSVVNAGRQDVDVQFCDDDAKIHSMDGYATTFEFVASMPHAKKRFDNGVVRGSEPLASPNDETSLNCKVQCLAGDVSNASCETQSLHVSLQTLFELRQKKAQQQALSDFQQKIELLDSEQFSLSEATTLLKFRAFNACSVDQLATMLRELQKIFPCTKLVRGIVVQTPNLLLQPAELVQQKLKILDDFQVKKQVVSKLCGKGRLLSLSVEVLHEKLVFYDHIGLNVDARNMMLSRAPRVLLFSIENHIQPILKLMETTGLPKESICNIVQHCPELLYMSLNTVIKKFEFFRQLGFSVNELPKACNRLRCLSIATMEERLQFLKDLGFTNHDVFLMIKRHPGILTHCPSSLKCKFDFLVCEQKRDMAEIVRSPSSLACSLQARIAPRFKVVSEFGSSKVYSLSYILNPSDSIFKERFGK